MLAEAKTQDEALAELRTRGASITDCIAAVRSFRHCEITEAKQVVESSPAFSDHRNVTGEFLQILAESGDENVS